MFKIILLSIFLIFNIEAFVKDPIYDEVEGYDLVEALIHDGKLDLAAIELSKENLKIQNTNRYHLLNGQLYFAKGQWDQAIVELKKSKKQPLAAIYLGRTYFEKKNYEKCSEAFKKADMVLVATEQDYIKKALCEMEHRIFARAFFTLKEAQVKYNSFAIQREMINSKIKMGIYHGALREAHSWFGKHKSSPAEYLDIVEKFYQIGRIEEALSILEMGRVSYPTDKDLNLTLSQLFFQKKLLRGSEEGFARAALKDPQYYYHAAEINRQIGNYERAQYLNNFVKDDKEKLKQKIATFVDANKFPLIASLEQVISRSELIKDDEIKYALAYSLVKMGQIKGPLKYLSSITKPELLEKTTVLRKTLLDCQNESSNCSL